MGSPRNPVGIIFVALFVLLIFPVAVAFATPYLSSATDDRTSMDGLGKPWSTKTFVPSGFVGYRGFDIDALNECP